MKLVFAIVQNDDSKRLIKELTRNNISVTRISSTGGFLHGGNSTLMIGTQEDHVQQVLDIIANRSSTRKEYMVVPTSLPGYVDNSPTPVQVTLGGATVFVVDVESFHKY